MMGVIENKVVELARRDPVFAARAGAAHGLEKLPPQAADIALEKLDELSLAHAKAAVHADLAVPEPFVRSGVTIKVTSIGMSGAMLRVELEATCPTDNPYLFVNPPVRVGKKDVDDPAAAFVDMVGSIVLSRARQLGWRG